MIPKGYYSGNKDDYPGQLNIDKSMTYNADGYGLQKTQMVVYELKEGNTHITYGVVIYFIDDLLLLLCDKGAWWRAFILSTKPLSGKLSKSLTEDVTTGIKELVESDPSPPSTPSNPSTPSDSSGACDE